MTRHDRLQMEQMLEEGYSPSYFNPKFAPNPSDKADGGTGGVPKVHLQDTDFTGVVYGDKAYLVKELGRIADALKRIADTLEEIKPYYKERICNNG